MRYLRLQQQLQPQIPYFADAGKVVLNMKTIHVDGESGIVSRHTSGAFRYHGWPTLAKLTDGTLVVGVSGHRMWHVCPFGKTQLFFSRDEGKTWSSPVVPNDTWLDDRDVGLCALPNNGLVMSWFNADYTLLDVRADRLKELYSPAELDLVNAYRAVAVQTEDEQPGAFLRFSRDGGMTWGEPRPTPVCNPHGPTLLKDGSLLHFAREYDEAIPFDDRRVIAMRSTDEGKTWQEIGRPGLPEGIKATNFVEPYALQLPSGRIVGVIRYQTRLAPDEPKQYGTFTLFCTISDDGGRTWSEPKWTGSIGAPGHLMVHSSGALICSYGCRTKGSYSERAMVSYDEGETWELDICINDNTPDGDLGYASTVELSDGSLLTAYYQKYVDGNGVADNKTSLLYTKWRLPRH